MFKKMFKKIATVATVATLAVGSLGVANAEDMSEMEITFTVSGVNAILGDNISGYKAQLGYADADWSNNDWTTNVDFKGDGTYTLKTTAREGDTPADQAEGAVVFVIDINGITTAILDELGLSNDDITGDDGAAKAANFAKETSITAKIDSIKVAGKELTIDTSKLLVGDLEDKGNLRLEIYNEYGSTKELGGVVNPADSNLKFGVVAAAESSTTAESSTGTDTATKTGDSTMVAVLAVVALLSLAGVVVTSKKRA